jgi:hypothetical protein
MTKNGPKYSKALLGSGEVCDIENITEADRGTEFACIACGGKLAPKLGDIRVHHFFHVRASDASSCSGETYLHRLTKLTLKKHLDYLLSTKGSFQAKLLGEESHRLRKGPAIWEKTNNDFLELDLLKDCLRIDLEKAFDSFRPDLCLHYKDGSATMLEVYVEHKSTFSKTSKHRVVEFRIVSEQDISRVIKGAIEEPDKFYGFDNLRPRSRRGRGQESRKQLSTQSREALSRRAPRQLLDGPPPPRFDIQSSVLGIEAEEKFLRSIVSLFDRGRLELEITSEIGGIGQKTAWLQLSHWYETVSLKFLSGRPYCLLKSPQGGKDCVISFEENLSKYIPYATKEIVLNSIRLDGRLISRPQIFRDNFKIPRIEFCSDLYSLWVEIPTGYSKSISKTRIGSAKDLAELIENTSVNDIEFFVGDRNG